MTCTLTGFIAEKHSDVKQRQEWGWGRSVCGNHLCLMGQDDGHADTLQDFQSVYTEHNILMQL